MNVQRLVKQLKREAKAHPTKAAVLAGLVAIGAYTWAPLVAGWLAPGYSDEETADAATTAAPQATTPDTNVPTTRSDEWLEWLAAGRQDPRRAPARWVFGGRDPFAPTGRQAEVLHHEKQLAQGKQTENSKIAASKAMTPPAQPKPPPITPKSLGLSLTSTAVQPDRQLALLKGTLLRDHRTVKQLLVKSGDLINVTSSKGITNPTPQSSTKKSAKQAAERSIAPPASETKLADGVVQFRVIKIEPRFVVLENAGNRHVLRLADPKLASTMTLRSESNRD